MGDRWICIILFGLSIAAVLNGCSSSKDWDDCDNPNTLSGFVYLVRGALDETDGTLDDDILISDSPNPPTEFQPFKGAKVTVEETGQNMTTGERGAFVFYPLPAGIYTLVIKFQDFPPVKRHKSVCVQQFRPIYIRDSDYYDRPPYYDPPPQPSDEDRPSQDTSGSWDDGGFSSAGEGDEASARRP